MAGGKSLRFDVAFGHLGLTGGMPGTMVPSSMKNSFQVLAACGLWMSTSGSLGGSAGRLSALSVMGDGPVRLFRMASDRVRRRGRTGPWPHPHDRHKAPPRPISDAAGPSWARTF